MSFGDGNLRERVSMLEAENALYKRLLEMAADRLDEAADELDALQSSAAREAARRREVEGQLADVLDLVRDLWDAMLGAWPNGGVTDFGVLERRVRGVLGEMLRPRV